MNRLNKEQIARRDELSASLRMKAEALEKSITAFNDKMVDEFRAVSDAANDYDAAIDEAREWCSDLSGEIADAISEKSDKWQESEKGEAANSWQGCFDDIDLDFSIPDAPDDLDMPDLDHAGALDNLPTSPEET